MKQLLKNLLLRWRWRGRLNLAMSAVVGFGSRFEGADTVSPGANFNGTMGYGSIIAHGSRVRAEVGRFVSLGPGVVTVPYRHPFKAPAVTTNPMFYSTLNQYGTTFATEQLADEARYADEARRLDVRIGSDCWICEGAFLTGGVTLGDGAVVLPRAVVTRDVPPYAIVGGVPAKVVGYRYDEETVGWLMRFRWWDKDISWLRANWRLMNDMERLRRTVGEDARLGIPDSEAHDPEPRNVLFVGGWFPEHMRQTVLDDNRGKIGMSNHNFEMSLIGGLAENVRRSRGRHLKLVSVPRVYSWPHNSRRMRIPAERWTEYGMEARSAGFVNIAPFNKIFMTLAAARNIAAALRSFPPGDVEVVVSSPVPYVTAALHMARMVARRRTGTTLVIPDVPSVMERMFGRKGNPLRRLAVDALTRLNMRLMRSFDRYVLLTADMRRFIPAGAPWIVMEGLADITSPVPVEEAEKVADISQEAVMEGEKPQKNTKSIRSVLYTGTLARVFGVMHLVEAFAMVPGDCELWICGGGDSADDIRRAAERDPRIRFFGLVGREEARRLQRQATVLVNPRTSQGEYTRYSFPSKTMEYMLAGKPVVMHRLPGIPDEYLPYLTVPEAETPEALAATLRRLLEMEDAELEEMGNMGRDFIMTRKNNVIQTRRILDLAASESARK